MTINLELHSKQSQCFTSEATEILYGGAAGGGKSHTMRVVAIAFALSVDNCQIYLFRRVFSDLAKNHIEGPSGFAALLAPLIETRFVSISESEVTFKNGSKIYLCHCQHEKDVIKYQGAEIHVLLIDELTHFSEKIYRFLRGRCRIGGLKVPEQYKNRLPLIICGSNPGGTGHQFVKETFIEGCEPMQIRRMPPEEGGMLRQYIPAKLEDNPTMMEGDPLYANKLLGLGGSLARAMLDGDWDAIEGCYFDNYDREKHVIEPFFIPHEWFKIRAFDWGGSAPFCVLWGAVSDGSLVECGGIKRVFPRGSIIIYREYYGWNGKANEGLNLDNREIAKNIKIMQGNEKMNEMVADPAIFSKHGAMSIAEQMAQDIPGIGNGRGIYWTPAANERVAGWQQVRGRLNGIDGQPTLYFFNTCKNLIRTLPVMQYDKTRPEDLDSSMEDHACFIAGTMVDTDKGKIQIEKLDPNLHKILAGNEWTSEYYPSLTREKAKTIKLTFENGVVVVCTPNHKILDSTDTWRYAKDFDNQLALWNQKSSTTRFKNIGVRIITSAVVITKRGALGFTDWFGKMQMVKYLRTATSTIKTKIRRIINFPILNAYLLSSTQESIMMRLEKKSGERILKKLSKPLSFGIKAKKVELGTSYIGRPHLEKNLLRRILKRIAKYVQRNITQPYKIGIEANSAGIIVRPVRCVSVEDWNEQAVYCLFEPKTNSFTIEGGLIVHNCDPLRYLCMARPTIIEVPKTPLALEEQWMRDFNPKNYAKNRKQNT